jgi:hypothetical protein
MGNIAQRKNTEVSMFSHDFSGNFSSLPHHRFCLARACRA